MSSKGTPSPDPTALAKQEVADVFRHMREEEAKAYNLGYTSKTKFDRYAANPALGKTNSELFDYRQAGVIFTGKPKSEFEVTAIDLENNPHKATITECFDITGWRPVLKATGKDVGTKGQVSRYTITSTAQIVGQGTSAAWMITDYTVDKARTC